MFSFHRAVLVPGLVALAVGQVALSAQFTWFVPGAVETPGANHAVFSSTLGLTNVGTAPAAVVLSLVPFSGKTAPAPASRILAVGESRRVEAVLRTLWDLTQDSGTLVVSSDQPLVVSLLTSNVADPTGTYGLSLLPVGEAELLRSGETGHAIWVSQAADATSGYRTNVNVTLVDPGTTVEVKVWDAAGTLKGTDVATSATPAVWQRSVADFAGPVPMGRVELRVTAGRATGYAVVNDNVTSDAIAVQTEKVGTGAGDVLLDGVAKAPGNNGTFWSTDVRAFNPGSAPLELTIEALGFPSRPAPVKWTLGPGEVAEYPKVLDAFGLPAPSAGALRVRAAGPFLIYGRTSNLDPSGTRPGTFSAGQRAVAWARAFQPAATAYLTGIDQADGATGFRTNLALLGGPEGSQGTLVLRDAAGLQKATSPFSRGALEWGQLGAATWFGGTVVPANARVDVVVTTGSVDGYLSRIDNGTGDAVVLPLVALPVCERPALTLTAPASACRGAAVTVAWQASDPQAKVAIEGIGTDLPAAGTREVTIGATVTFSGKAVNACGEGPAVARKVEALDSLRIASLTASPDPAVLGEPVTLSWQVDGTATAQTLVDSELGPVPLNGTQRATTVLPAASGVHTARLAVTGTCGSAEETVEYVVENPPQPEILSFTATPGEVSPGSSALLAWTTRNALECSIDKGIGTVPCDGSLTVFPLETTVYTLTASNCPAGTEGANVRYDEFCQTNTVTAAAGCSTSGNASVTVTPAPSISSFTATPSTISFFGTSTLNFTIANATSWTLSSSLGNSFGPSSGAGNGPFSSTYSADNGTGTDTVTLTVTGPCGTTTQTVQIIVN